MRHDFLKYYDYNDYYHLDIMKKEIGYYTKYYSIGFDGTDFLFNFDYDYQYSGYRECNMSSFINNEVYKIESEGGVFDENNEKQFMEVLENAEEECNSEYIEEGIDWTLLTMMLLHTIQEQKICVTLSDYGPIRPNINVPIGDVIINPTDFDVLFPELFEGKDMIFKFYTKEWRWYLWDGYYNGQEKDSGVHINSNTMTQR